MEQNKMPQREIFTLAIGEVVVAALVCGGFAVANALGAYSFDYRVITGALLGGVVTVANYALLTISVNNAVNNFMALRGSREMTDEEADRFAAENSAPIQNAIKSSFIIRTVSMMATLLIAFITGWFNPLATAIPLLAFRPLISIGEIIRKKYDKAPNPDNFIKYENNDGKEGEN